jgi:hypothetical protein
MTKLIGVHSRHTVKDARIPVGVDDINVVNDVYVVNQYIMLAIASVESPSPPGVEDFERG